MMLAKQARKGTGRWWGLAATSLSALALVGCGSATTTGSQSASATGSQPAATRSQTGSATAVASSGASNSSSLACGAVDPKLAPDPSGLLKTLPQAAQAAYTYDPYPVQATPWTAFAGKKPPYKLAYVGEPYYGSAGWVSHVAKEFQTLADQYKRAGLVSSFKEFTPPDPATATPAQQIAAFQQMVRSGVDGIFVLPLSSQAMNATVDAAGKAGLPVIGVDTIFPGSKYVFSVWGNNQEPTYPATMKIIHGTGNVLIVRGIPGGVDEQLWYDEAQQAIKACPNVKVVGTVYSQWVDATAKTNILSWVAAHPGVKIDAVLQMGGVTQGIMGAFQQLGGKMPAISVAPCSVGQLSYQLAHKSQGYDMASTCFSGYQTAWSSWGAMMRILAGNGPKTSYVPVSFQDKLITNANLTSIAKPNQPLDDSDEPAGQIDSWASDNYMNMWFKKPGTPGR
jgi:ABC-type sugar transport system substrate-binding protein